MRCRVREPMAWRACGTGDSPAARCDGDATPRRTPAGTRTVSRCSTISPSSPIGKHAAISARITPISAWLANGVWNRGCTALKKFGSSRSCDIENRIRACPNSKTKITVVNPASAANFTRTDSHVIPVTSIATATGSATSRLLVRHHAGHHECHQDIEDGADDQRAQDPDRHVLLRSSCLLRGGRDGVEADIGKEHHRRAAQDAAPAELAERAGVRRDEGDPVRSGHVDHADNDDDADDEQLERHHDVVDACRFPGAEHQQAGEQQNDQDGRQIKDGCHRGAICQFPHLAGRAAPIAPGNGCRNCRAD